MFFRVCVPLCVAYMPCPERLPSPVPDVVAVAETPIWAHPGPRQLHERRQPPARPSGRIRTRDPT